LVRENHPDVAADKERAHEQMQLILTAWNVLSDPGQRARYDLTRRVFRSNTTSTPSSSPPSSNSPPPSSGSSPFYKPRPQAPVNSTEEAKKRARVEQAMRGGAPPRSGNARTRLLTMVFEAAQLYHVEGRADEAIRVCNQVMKADPTNAEAVALLGDIYAEQDRKDVALAMYEKAMRLQPNNLLYRQKWDKLRHGIVKTAETTPEPAARSGPNPYARQPRRASLSERLATGEITFDESTRGDKDDPLMRLRREAQAQTAANTEEDAPATNVEAVSKDTATDAPLITPPPPAEGADTAAQPPSTPTDTGSSGFRKIKLPWRR
jgi:curved DNA-binding protein CbpA